MKISLNKIKNKKPCGDGFKKLLKSLGKTKADSTEVSINQILMSNGVGDTLWVIYKCTKGYEIDKRNMIADIAETVLYIWEDWAKDNMPEHLKVARRAIEFCRDESASQAPNIEIPQIPEQYTMYAEVTAYIATWAANSAIWAANTVEAARDPAKVGWAALAAGTAASWADRAAVHSSIETNEKQTQKEIILRYFGEQ